MAERDKVYRARRTKSGPLVGLGEMMRAQVVRLHDVLPVRTTTAEPPVFPPALARPGTVESTTILPEAPDHMPSRLGRGVAIAAAVLLTFATAGGVTQLALNNGDDREAATTKVEIAKSNDSVSTPIVQAGAVSTPTVPPTTAAPAEEQSAPDAPAATATASTKNTGTAAGGSGPSNTTPANNGVSPTPAENGSSSATPAETPSTAAPVAAPKYSDSTDDGTTSGAQRFSYSGNWGVCSNCAGAYGGTGNYRYASDTGASATYTFDGRQGKLYVIFGEAGARVSIKVDGREVTQWDTYAANRQGRWYDTGVLGDSNATHNITVTIVGKGSSGGTTVAVDRGEVWR